MWCECGILLLTYQVTPGNWDYQQQLSFSTTPWSSTLERPAFYWKKAPGHPLLSRRVTSYYTNLNSGTIGGQLLEGDDSYVITRTCFALANDDTWAHWSFGSHVRINPAKIYIYTIYTFDDIVTYLDRFISLNSFHPFSPSCLRLTLSSALPIPHSHALSHWPCSTKDWDITRCLPHRIQKSLKDIILSDSCPRSWSMRSTARR